MAGPTTLFHPLDDYFAKVTSLAVYQNVLVALVRKVNDVNCLYVQGSWNTMKEVNSPPSPAQKSKSHLVFFFSNVLY